jgi:hypothetical protein
MARLSRRRTPKAFLAKKQAMVPRQGYLIEIVLNMPESENNAGMFAVVIVWCCGGTPVIEWHIPFIFDPISSYASQKSMGA